jgi:hypothetical protein
MESTGYPTHGILLPDQRLGNSYELMHISVRMAR